MAKTVLERGEGVGKLQGEKKTQKKMNVSLSLQLKGGNLDGVSVRNELLVH